MNQVIPEAAVEAAAKAAYESTMEDGDTQWEHFGGSHYLDYYRAHARAALEAAAPHIAADAWDEGYQGCYDRYMYEPVPTNPYRTAK